VVELGRSLLGLLRRLGWWEAVGLTLGLAVGSLLLAAAVVVQWPVDQFKTAEPPAFWAHRHPVVRVGGLVAKNLLGYLAVIAGAIMALPGVPGQGLLMILIGLTLLNFPGKRGLERRLIRRPAILHGINRLRTRLGHPELELDEDEGEPPGPRGRAG
jgi:hypothetical protein